MTGPTALYRRALGRVFDDLPPEIRAIHGRTDGGAAFGHCHIRRGRGLPARWIGRRLGFPPAGRNVPVRVRFEVNGPREIWRRDFAGHELVSIQEPAGDRGSARLIERFGPCAVELAVPAGPDGLRLEPRRLWLFGVPLPRVLLPQVQASERVQRGRFRFDVRIALPVVGLLVHYRGYLSPGPADPPAAPGGAMAGEPRAVMLFDGVCGLCNGAVRFILPRDPAGRIRFAAMQSPAGQAVLRRLGLPCDEFETFAVLEGDRFSIKSDAVLRLAARMRWPWPLFGVFRLVPRPLRDALYDGIARNRYRLMGRRAACVVPPAPLRHRFLVRVRDLPSAWNPSTLR